RSFVLHRPPSSTLFPYTTLFRSHPRKRRPVPPPARPGLLEHRLLAVHPAHRARRSGARGAVERQRQDRMRAPHVHRETGGVSSRSEEHTSELQSPCNLVCRLLLE